MVRYFEGREVNDLDEIVMALNAMIARAEAKSVALSKR